MRANRQERSPHFRMDRPPSDPVRYREHCSFPHKWQSLGVHRLGFRVSSDRSSDTRKWAFPSRAQIRNISSSGSDGGNGCGLGDDLDANERAHDVRNQPPCALRAGGVVQAAFPSTRQQSRHSRARCVLRRRTQAGADGCWHSQRRRSYRATSNPLRRSGWYRGRNVPGLRSLRRLAIVRFEQVAERPRKIGSLPTFGAEPVHVILSLGTDMRGQISVADFSLFDQGRKLLGQRLRIRAGGESPIPRGCPQ